MERQPQPLPSLWRCGGGPSCSSSRHWLRPPPPCIQARFSLQCCHHQEARHGEVAVSGPALVVAARVMGSQWSGAGSRVPLLPSLAPGLSQSTVELKVCPVASGSTCCCCQTQSMWLGPALPPQALSLTFLSPKSTGGGWGGGKPSSGSPGLVASSPQAGQTAPHLLHVPPLHFVAHYLAGAGSSQARRGRA